MSARRLLLLASLGLVLATALAQTPAPATLPGQATVRHLNARSVGNAGVVVWLTPVTGSAPTVTPARTYQMAQRNKTFEPHLLVIPTGSMVAFPNFDPFFHNVFSLGNDRPFDLLLYQGGASRSQRFSRPGITYVFCNIHPQMSAVIVTVPTPWYGISDAAGAYALPAPPPGEYQLHVWYERAQPADLARLQRQVEIAPNTGLPSFQVDESPVPAMHKNKYGQDYDTPSSYGTVDQ